MRLISLSRRGATVGMLTCALAVGAVPASALAAAAECKYDKGAYSDGIVIKTDTGYWKCVDGSWVQVSSP